MTTTAPLSVPVPSPSGPTPPDDDDSSGRDGPGRLRIDPRVVQKLAARAANEVDGVTRASVGSIGRAVHRPVPASTPQDQLAVDLDLTVSIRYPLSVRAVVERLAAHVSRQVERLTGRPVGRVSVTVQRLGGHEAGSHEPRVH